MGLDNLSSSKHVSYNISPPPLHNPKRTPDPFTLHIACPGPRLPEHISQIPYGPLRTLPGPKVAPGIVVAIKDYRAEFAVPG